MAGVGLGWVSPILNRYKDSAGEFSLTEEDCSWIASMHYMGRGIGCLVAAITLDRVGRCSLFVFNAVLFLLVWTVVALTKTVLIHYVIRFVFGLAVGIFDTAGPIYIGEISSPNLRGIFGTSICVTFFGGIELTFVIATYASYTTTAVILIAFALLTLLSSVLLREPPQYLIMKGDESKAEKQFTWLRGTGDEAKNEFDDLKAKLADVDTQFSMKMFSNRGVRIATILNVLIFLSGYPAINAFLSFILTPTAGWTANQLTILCGLTQVIGVTMSTVVVEQFGRRTLWMVSGILCTAAHLAAVSLCCFSGHQASHPCFAWTIFAIVATYITVFAALLLPLSTTARSELLPAQFKAAGVCTTILVSSVTAFVVARVFFIVTNAYGLVMNFVFYTFVSLTMLAYVYFFLPETKGLTLMEIQKLLDA